VRLLTDWMKKARPSRSGKNRLLHWNVNRVKLNFVMKVSLLQMLVVSLFYFGRVFLNFISCASWFIHSPAGLELCTTAINNPLCQQLKSGQPGAP
jgi:hypothetical protein